MTTESHPNATRTVCTVAGWLLFLLAFGLAFLTPTGRINGAVLTALACVLTGAWLIERGRPEIGGADQ